MKWYSLHGLQVRSTIELPANALSTPSGDPIALSLQRLPDVRIVEAAPAGTLLATDGRRQGKLTVTRCGADDILIRYGARAQYRWQRALTSCTVELAPNEPASVAELLFSSSVSSFILSLEGRCVLHASAVKLDGETYVFVGNSGQGKTTLAAALCAQGASLITDDALHLRPTDSGWWGDCGTNTLRLRQPLSHLGLLKAPSSHLSVDGRTTLRPPPQLSVCPIRRLILVTAQANMSLAYQPCLRRDAFMPLALGMRSLGWVEEHYQRLQFEWVRRLASEIDIVELSFCPLALQTNAGQVQLRALLASNA